MNALASLWFAYVTDVFWQSSIVVSLVLIAYVVLRKQSAALRYGVLCLVLVKLLLPPSLRLETSLGACIPAVSEVSRRVLGQPANSPQEVLPPGASAAPVPAVRKSKAVDRPLTAATVHRTVGRPKPDLCIRPTAVRFVSRFGDSAAQQDALRFWLFACWVAVAGALAMLHVFRLAHIRRKYRRSTLAHSPELQRIVDRARVAMKLHRHVDACVRPGIPTPVVVGLLRPRIVFPADNLTSLSSTEIKLLVCHELAHVKRFDLQVNALQIALQILWFFHPGVWFVNYLIRKEREMACDDKALLVENRTQNEYAETVLKAVKLGKGYVSQSPALVGLFSTHSDMFSRIKRLLQGGYALRPVIRLRELAVLAGVALVALPLARCENNGLFDALFSRRYRALAHTCWKGGFFAEANNTEGFRVRLVIDSVAGKWFSGQAFWGQTGMVYAEGQFFGRDSLMFTQLETIIAPGSDVPVHDTFRGRMVGDAIQGRWLHPTSEFSGSRFAMVRNRAFRSTNAAEKGAIARYLALRAGGIIDSLALPLVESGVHGLPTVVPSYTAPWDTLPSDAKVIRECKLLLQKHLEAGQSALPQDVYDLWQRNDSASAGNVAYWLLKYSALQATGNDDAAYARASAAFNMVPDDSLTDPGHLFNRLQDRIFADPPNLSSVLRLARRLSLCGDLSMLEDWLHDSFAQLFIISSGQQQANLQKFRRLLDAMGSAEYPALAAMSSGLRAWTEALRCQSNPAKLREIAARPMSSLRSRSERYTLLVAEIMDAHGPLHAKAQDLRRQIVSELRGHLSGSDTLSATGRRVTEPRTRDRYLLATACWHYAASLGFHDATAQGSAWYRLAAQNTPTAEDRDRNWLYFYERTMLGGPEEFHSAYARHLESIGRPDEALAEWESLARQDPSKLPEVQRLFAQLRTSDTFSAYWAAKEEEGLAHAPDFALPNPTGDTLRLSALRGKWVLVDFWATWCGPCRAQLPNVQSIATEALSAGASTATVLTIACSDEAKSVRRFMATNKYTFPVVMSDKTVERAFNITGYPTTFLVTPSGHLIPLDRGDGWPDVVRGRMFPKPQA